MTVASVRQETDRRQGAHNYFIPKKSLLPNSSSNQMHPFITFLSLRILFIGYTDVRRNKKIFIIYQQGGRSKVHKNISKRLEIAGECHPARSTTSRKKRWLRNVVVVEDSDSYGGSHGVPGENMTHGEVETATNCDPSLLVTM